MYAADAGVTERDLQRLEAFFSNQTVADAQLPLVIVRTKCDLVSTPANNESILKVAAAHNALDVSS